MPPLPGRWPGHCPCCLFSSQKWKAGSIYLQAKVPPTPPQGRGGMSPVIMGLVSHLLLAGGHSLPDQYLLPPGSGAGGGVGWI